MHNGQIAGFERLRRELTFMIDPGYFPKLRGTTDSEVFFYLLLTLGGAEDPVGAYARAVGRVPEVMAAAGLEGFHMTAALSDGRTLYALRYASDGQAPSLYYGCGVDLDSDTGHEDEATGDALLVLSEPLDEDKAPWREVPQSHLLVAGDGGIAVMPFVPTGTPSGTVAAQTRAASA